MRDIQDYTQKYMEYSPFEETMVKIRRKTVVEQCMSYPHKKILEVGCGMDPLFVSMDDYEYMVIVEPSTRFVQNAVTLAEKNHVHDKVEVMEGLIEEAADVLKDKGMGFDIVVVSSLLHEVDEPDKLLRSVHGICGKNTVVHVNVPNADSLHRMIAMEAGLISDVHEKSNQQIKLQQHSTYDMQYLQQEVEQAGFSVIDKGFYFIKPFTHAQMQACIDSGIMDEKVLLGLEKIIKYFPEYGAEMYVNLKVK